MQHLIFLSFFFISFHSLAYNSEAFPLLLEGQKKIDLSMTYDSTEIEYERNDRILTMSEAKYLRLNFDFAYSFIEKLTVNLGFTASTFGELKKTYDESLNLPNEKIQFRGIQRSQLNIKYDLPLSNEKSKYFGEIITKGSLQNAKETNNAYGGFDGGIRFNYTHKHREHYFLGFIESSIIGRKKTKLARGEKEVINSYSKFGSSIGYLFEDNLLTSKISTYFFHTTDYNVKSPTISRITDKGFIWGGEVKFTLRINPTQNIYLMHLRETYVFNVVETHQQGSIDFEIERNETQLGYSWLF